MQFSVFKSKVTELMLRKPLWFALESDPPASDADISAAEAALRVRLPVAYREFVRAFGGGYFAFGNVFSVRRDSEWNIVKRNESIGIPEFIAASDDNAGGYYGFAVKDKQCDDRIWLWDNEDFSGLKSTEYDDLLDLLDHIALSPSY